VHELSLANEICDIVERQLRDAGPGALAQVTTVVVEVGVDANVERSSLTFCLEALLTTPPFARGRPVLEMVPGDDLRVSWFELDDDVEQSSGGASVVERDHDALCGVVHSSGPGNGPGNGATER
jgi:Zn finger protein HypA/HybF involved in hydrogenase expression